MKQHRNSQKRIYICDACYFVTSKTFNNFPYFKERIFCDLFVENLRLCKRLKKFRLYGWVIIYDHIHMQIQPNDERNISDVMFSIKKQFSHDVNRAMGLNELYPQSKAGKRLPAFGVDEYSLVTGGNNNQNRQLIIHHQNFVAKLYKQFKQKHPNNHPFPKFKWQESFRDHYIRNETDFIKHMKYIAGNPDKHGMPKDWPYVFTNPQYINLIDEF